MDPITYLPPDLWLIIIEKLAMGYADKNLKNLTKSGMSPNFCNMRLVCRLFRNLSMKITWGVVLTKTKMFTEKMTFFSKIYGNHCTTKLPPFGFPKCKFVYFAKNRRDLMAIKNYSHIFFKVYYQPSFSYHTIIYNDLLSLNDKQTFFYIETLNFMSHEHIAGDNQANLQMINMGFREFCKLSVGVVAMLLNERQLMLKQPQPLNEYNGLSVGAYVPKCKYLLITAGIKSIDDGTHRCFVDKFNLVERVEGQPGDFLNYVHVHNIRTIILQYITIVNFDAFLHMFPNVEHVTLGIHVGKKPLFVKYLESRNIKVIIH